MRVKVVGVIAGVLFWSWVIMILVGSLWNEYTILAPIGYTAAFVSFLSFLLVRAFIVGFVKRLK